MRVRRDKNKSELFEGKDNATWLVQLKSEGPAIEISAAAAQIEDGCLVLLDEDGALVVAYARGMWQIVHPAPGIAAVEVSDD